jgi:integrase/recombinase XerD
MRKLKHFDFDTNGIEYKKEKLENLFEKLHSKWKSDSLILSELIEFEVKDDTQAIGFSKYEHINMEMKYSLSKILNSEDNWNKDRLRSHLYGIQNIISFINYYPELPSLLVLCKDNKMNDFINFLSNENIITKTSQLFTKAFIVKILNVLLDVYDDREEYIKDTWDAQKVGLINSSTKNLNTINFMEIHPLWLRNSLKKYIKLNVHNLSTNTVSGMIHAIKKLSVFLVNNYPQIDSKSLSRELISFFLLDLQQTVGKESLHSYVSKYKVFFEFLYLNDNKNFPRILILKDDVPQKPKSVPRFIPDYVLEQLESKIENLQSDFYTLMKIELETGIRHSDLLFLKTKSVINDEDGDSYLKYYQGKSKKDHIIPISKELTGIIAVQEEVVKNKYGNEIFYLFPNSKGNPYSSSFVTEKIQTLCKEYEIRNEEGEIHHFNMHDVRHTVGTKMINSGVPQHFVKKFLGHENSRTTMIYARILNKTLKKEILPKNNIFVSINGAMRINDDNIGLKNEEIYSQVLPNGYCSLSTELSCPHSNACLTCTHFRTDKSFLPTHINQIVETKLLIKTAITNKWERQVQTNTEVLTNLEKMVKELSEIKVTSNEK